MSQGTWAKAGEGNRCASSVGSAIIGSLDSGWQWLKWEDIWERGEGEFIVAEAFLDVGSGFRSASRNILASRVGRHEMTLVFFYPQFFLLVGPHPCLFGVEHEYYAHFSCTLKKTWRCGSVSANLLHI